MEDVEFQEMKGSSRNGGDYCPRLSMTPALILGIKILKVV